MISLSGLVYATSENNKLQYSLTAYLPPLNF